MKAIVSADLNWGIGYKGKLLLRIPEDMARFRRMTIGKVVVMGRETFRSLPGGEPLKDRTNIVLSMDRGFVSEKVTICRSLDELFQALRQYDTDDVYVIGGGAVYAQLLPYCTEAHVTRIEGSYQADTFFPDMDREQGWEAVSESDWQTYGDIAYRYVTYMNRYPKSYRQ